MEQWDITLDGQGYMIQPGSYRATGTRVQSTTTGGTTRRRHDVTDFSDGMTGEQLFAVEPGGAWPAPWPVGNRAIGPGPGRNQVLGSLNDDEPKLSTTSDEYLYIASGDGLYRWSGAGTVTARLTLPADAVDIARLGSEIFVAFGGSEDVLRWDDDTSTSTESVLGEDVTARRLGAVGEMLVVAPADTPDRVEVWNGSLTDSTTVRLAGEVRRIATGGDQLLIATNRELYALRGLHYLNFEVESWGAVTTVQQAEDDFAWLTLYRGRVLAWVGGQVMAYQPGSDAWEPLGLAGVSSSGAAVVHGWLMVCARPDGASNEQLWGYDGSGWWPLHEPDSFPASAANGLLATFEPNDDTLYSYDLVDLNSAGNLVSEFEVRTGLLDGESPGLEKAWRSIGVELTRVDGRNVGSWTCELAYSTDGGESWSVAGSSLVQDGFATLSEEIDVSASAIRVHVVAESQGGLPSFIRAIWAEYETSDVESVATGGRRWTFTIAAGEGGIDRDGALDSRTGQQVRDALWDLLDDGLAVTFRDVDYGASAVEHSVRLVEISEEWPKPYDQPALGAETQVRVTLEEA